MTDARNLDSGAGAEVNGLAVLEKRELPPFSAWVKEFRAKLGIQTQWEFAHLLKVPQSTVNRWETGATTPRFVHLEALWRLAIDHDLLPFFGQLTFESVFLCRDIWRAETAEQPNRAFLRATLRNRTGIAARVLTVLAAHGCDIVRVAGFQDGQSPGTSIFRVIFVLPENKSLDDVDADLTALENVLATEYPVRPVVGEKALQ